MAKHPEHQKETIRRKAAETALYSSQEIFALLVSAVRDYAIFVLDPDGFIQTWNTGARRLKGYEETEIIGTHFSRFYTPEDTVKKHPEWELEQAKKNGTYEEEGWRVRKDGSRFWASVVITALRDKNGILQGFGKVTRDLTERKKNEDLLKESHSTLEKRVEERTAELAKAKEQAEQALRSREEFFSIASHELRTPLTSLKLKSQMAKRSIKKIGNLTPLESDLSAYVTETDEQFDRLIKLVNDMLDLSRITQGKLPIDPEKVDLCDLVRNTVARMQIHFNETHAPITFKGCVENASIWADPSRIDQVLTNLLTNTLRYAPGTPVEVEVSRESNFVRLSVLDHGPGIPKESQQRIFQRYERLVPSNNISGLGIGLYLSRSIIECHGGEITVQSEPGKGAKFTVDLPLYDNNEKNLADKEFVYDE